MIATGSVRRQRQLRWKRPDLKVVDLRGNVPTRLRKLDENEDWSGIILARAGSGAARAESWKGKFFQRKISFPRAGRG